MAIQLRVWGDYALFTRAELKVEKVSYPVMTPSAARGILDAIYYHPGLRWVVDRITVLNPIRYTNIRRNELKSKILASSVRSVMMGTSKPLYINRGEDIQQRAAMVLKDVAYVIDAHFIMTDRANPSDNPGKFQDIMRRRVEKGKCFTQPYLGVREFPAHFAHFQEGEQPDASLRKEQDLGYMLFDMDYTDPENIEPTFFHAVLRDGVLDLRNCEVVR